MFTGKRNFIAIFGPHNKSFNETTKLNNIPMVQQPDYVRNITSLKNMTYFNRVNRDIKCH